MFVNVSKTIVKHTSSDASFVSMTETAWTLNLNPLYELTSPLYPLQISSAGRAVAVFHTRQPMQRATSRATRRKMLP